MTLADITLLYAWLGITAYALFGGADFGGGFWDLIAGSAQRGAAQRARIEHSIGPVWEANHVWLIFVLVVVWTGFPTVFAAVASTLYIPLTLAAFGIILRGSAFAFRKSVTTVTQRRLFGATFALSSVMTPFFFGTIAGAIASGRVPPGVGRGDVVGSWLSPISVLGGVLAVGVCAVLAAVYVAEDARRNDDNAVAEQFRRRALIAGVAVGVVALCGIGILSRDAPALYAGLVERAWWLILVSIVCGSATLLAMWKRRYILARPLVALAVTAVLWGWGVAQYPRMLGSGVTVHTAAAHSATLTALIVSLTAGAALIVPSLVLLYVLMQQKEPTI